MGSIVFAEAVIACDAVHAALDWADALDVEGLSTGERVELLARRQGWRRRLPAGEHELINELARASGEEVGGPLPAMLADRLRIRRSEATRRIAEAADLGPRRALTGQVLAPRLEHTAAGQREGKIGAEHVRVIRGFFGRLPCWVDEPTRADAEQRLAAVAGQCRPDELARFAAHLEVVLNPDGTFSDADRARRRGVSVGPQGPDGMSRLSGWLDPQLRAGLDAVLAKWAAPGMCNPADADPTVAGAPPRQGIDADVRSPAQRTHDGLGAMVRATLMSGELGSHQGLPVTIVATVALQDLQAKTGVAHTATGTVLPMADVLRLAGHAYNYLLVFDTAKRCQLYRGRTTRLATPRSGWCSTPPSVAVRGRAVTCPRPGARCTTCRTGPAAGAPTSTSSPWPADPTTDWPPTPAGRPEKTTRAKQNGSHPRTTTAGSGEGTTSIIQNECWLTTWTAANCGRPGRPG
jgi:hypothetical protein